MNCSFLPGSGDVETVIVRRTAPPSSGVLVGRDLIDLEQLARLSLLALTLRYAWFIRIDALILRGGSPERLRARFSCLAEESHMSWLARRMPTAPVGFDQEQFFAGIRWHQKWQLFQGIFTPGVNPIEEMCDDLTLPKNLAGKRVLDVGAWHGCLSFECERRGAREVVALSPEDPEGTGFHKLREVLDSRKVHYLRGTVYDLNPRKLGYFDVVLFCGVLYYLRYPLLGIDNIRRVCRGDVYVETVVSDAQFMVREGGTVKRVPMVEVSPYLLSAPLWQFYRFDELNGDPSSWFGPNCFAVVQA